MAPIAAPPARRGPIVLCLGLILLYPLLSVAMQGSIQHLSSTTGELGARVLTETAIWLYAAIVLAIALFWEQRSLASIGLRYPTIATASFGIGAALAITAVGGASAYVVYGLLHQPQHAEAQAAAIARGSVVYALCLAVRAGALEELLFRGLAIEQLTRLTGRRWLAASLATLAFIGLHALRFDWVQLIPIATASIVLTVLYVWRRDLLANMIAHIAVDATGLVILALRTHQLTH
jgi:membrane protease YdiL (CAAX protease family)